MNQVVGLRDCQLILQEILYQTVITDRSIALFPKRISGTNEGLQKVQIAILFMDLSQKRFAVRQVQKSGRINSDHQSGSDQLGSTRTNSDRIKKKQ